MSKITKIRVNSPGVVELLKSAGVANDLQRRSANIHAALPTDNGQKWSTADYIGRDRAASVVKTANQAARVDNAENNSLARALPAGGH